MNRLLVVDLREASLTVADVERDGAGVRLHGLQQTPRSPDLTADLRAAVRELGTSRTPRSAVCLSPRVTAVCLDLPPADGLTDARLEGLVRWELEPFLDAPADPGAPLACGWSTVPGPGPVFAAGLAPTEKTVLVEAFAGAGLRLEQVYPSGGCAAATVPGAAAAQQVLEVEDERVAVSRLEAGRVTRFRILPTTPADRPALLASLEDEAAPAVEAEAEPLPASLHGAARHALGLEGGARLPAIAARPPQGPLLQRPAARAALLALTVALLLVGAELFGARRLSSAEQRAADARAALSQAERVRDRQTQLTRLQAQLSERSASVAREERVLAACAQRAAYLPALLRALAASLPRDVALDEVREEPDTSLWIEGFALSDLDTKTFLRDLTERLRPLGLVAREPVVRRRKGRFGVEGYRFVLRFQLEDER